MAKVTLISSGFRLSLTADHLLAATARALGVSKTAAVEMAIRRMAKAEGIPMPDEAELERQYSARKEENT
jgi:hypothetical protein